MVNISKEIFVKSLNGIQEGLKKRTELNKALEMFCDSYVVLNIGNEWLNTALHLLEQAVGDEEGEYGSMISWWLYESVDKKIYISPNSKLNNTEKEIEIDVSTPEKLYDYFVEYGSTINE